MASVKVAVRVRPLNKREMDMGSSIVVKVDGNTTQLFNNKMSEPIYEVFGSRDKIKQFTFDHSYWSVDSSHPNFAPQDKIFNDLGIGVVESSFSGYNACIFAYGQTGSGKTHTMMGTEKNPGLTPRICESMFANMDKPDLTYRTEVSFCEIVQEESYLEIYNEHVRDLLRENHCTNLKIREHPKDGPYVQDLSRRVVTSYREIAELLTRGNLNRTTASTNMNEHSSRSHAIFTIYFSQARISGDLPSEINSKVHLVDLAGSERADSAGTIGDRLKEGGSINKSLVTLGSVISALAEACDSASTTSLSSSSSLGQRKFVPYRNSVLTWLLKDSLGGNSRTVMVATISPAECCHSETLSTLRYAKRAKKIMNRPSVNEDCNVRLIRELRAENAKLKRLLADAMMQEGLTPLSEVAETREKLSKNEEKMQELMEAWADKWKEVISVLKEHDMLALRKEGSGVLLDSGLPYLLCIDDSVLSTGMKLYHIKEGDTVIGKDNPIHKPDIVLMGRFIENIHCIVRSEYGSCYLVPGDGAMCCIDSIQVVEPAKLTQGSMIQLGRNHFFRFNDPAEAAKLRKEMNEGYDRGNMSHIWKDIQRASSTFSMTDSAIDSDVSMVKQDVHLREWLDNERHELKRKVIEKKKETDDEDDEECRSDVVKIQSLAHAQDKIRMLKLEIEQQLGTSNGVDNENNTQHQENKKLIDAEYEMLMMERERQEEEWCELEKQKHHQLSIRLDDQTYLNKRQEWLEKIRETEKKIWSGEIEEMRSMIDEEVYQLCEGSNFNHLINQSNPTRRRRRRRSSLSSSSQLTSCTSSFDLQRLPSKCCCHMSLDHLAASNKRADHGDALQCSSLDRFMRRHDGRHIHSSTPRHSTFSGATFEELMTSDIDALKLSAISFDENFSRDDPKLPENHESFFSSLSMSSDEESQVTASFISDKTTDLYQIVRHIFINQFGTRSGKWLKISQERQDIIRRLNDKLLTIKKLHLKTQSSDGKETQAHKIELVGSLLELYECILLMEGEQGRSLYLEAAQVLLKITELAKMCKHLLEEEEDDEMKALVQTEVCVRREMFLYAVNEQWDQHVEWNLSKKTSRSSIVDLNSKVALDLKMAVNNRKKMKSICEALHSCHVLDNKLRSFSTNFIELIMRPGILGGFLPHSEDTPCSIQVVQQPHSTLLDLTSDLLSSSQTIASQPPPFSSSSSSNYHSPHDTMERMEQCFRLLWCTFSFPVESDPSCSIVARIGKLVCDETFRLLCQYCLLPYFSSLDFQSVEERDRHDDDDLQISVADCPAWKQFNNVLHTAYNFQKQLIQLGFLVDFSSLSFFVQLAPSIRKCFSCRHKQFLRAARSIGISSLGEVVRVSSRYSIGGFDDDDDDDAEEAVGESFGDDNDDNDSLEKGVSRKKVAVKGSDSQSSSNAELQNDCLHDFIERCVTSVGRVKIPSCSVSSCSCDFVKLLYTILREAQSCHPSVAVLLQSSINNVAQCFLDLVSNHQHTNMPLFEALIHNSCLFVAQHLNTISKIFSRLLSTLPVESVEQKLANEKNLKKIRNQLKGMAHQIFSDAIDKQKKSILAVLSSTAGFACSADDEGTELKISIQKVLDLIEEVSTSWSSVLSSSLYFISIGMLLNEFVSEVVKLVLGVVEFSEDDCNVLRDVLAIIINTSPSFFLKISSPSLNVQLLLHDHVSSWMKLTELHLLLGSSLNDIRDRWSSGLGPLSLHFTADQVVGLVRAIFETTSKREVIVQEILSNPSVHVTPS